jgi:hypothetical protein
LDTLAGRVSLVDFFNLSFMAEVRLWETIHDPQWICKFIEEVWFLTKNQLPDIQSGADRINVTLRMWAGCTSSAKIIRFTSVVAPEYNVMTKITCEKVIRSVTRATESAIVDEIAKNDPIFRAGAEAGTEFKKTHMQYFSFHGVNTNSAIARYPNEYLIDTETKVCEEEVSGHRYKRFYYNCRIIA